MQAALPLMVAGKVLRGVGGFAAGQYNSRALNSQAQEELLLGNEQAAQVRRAARRTMGQQVGALATSGFTIGDGAALGALEESLIAREVDVLQSLRTATGRAAGLRAQATMERQKGRMALLESIVDAGSAAASFGSDRAAAAGPEPRPTGAASLVAGNAGIMNENVLYRILGVSPAGQPLRRNALTGGGS